MLIELDESLQSHLDTPQVRAALENILTAGAEGKHLVVASRRFADQLCRNIGSGSRAWAEAKRAKDFYSERNNAKAHVLVYARIIGTGGDPPVLIKERNVDVIEVSPRLFADSLSTQASILLAENLNDALLYRHLALRFVRVHFGERVPLRFDPQGGGGATTSAALASAVNTNRICLCVFDSDKKSSSGRSGSTARTIKAVSTTALQRKRELNAMEIENMIPPSVLKRAFEGTAVYDLAERLARALQVLGSDYLWFDLKVGARVREVGTSRSRTLGAACCKRTVCTDNACQCRAIPGLGDRILDQINQRFERGDLNAMTKDEFRHFDLEDVCWLVMSFGWASTVRRT